MRAKSAHKHVRFTRCTSFVTTCDEIDAQESAAMLAIPNRLEGDLRQTALGCSGWTWASSLLRLASLHRSPACPEEPSHCGSGLLIACRMRELSPPVVQIPRSACSSDAVPPRLCGESAGEKGVSVTENISYKVFDVCQQKRGCSREETFSGTRSGSETSVLVCWLLVQRVGFM